jgi:hypothetical protein
MDMRPSWPQITTGGVTILTSPDPTLRLRLSFQEKADFGPEAAARAIGSSMEEHPSRSYWPLVRWSCVDLRYHHCASPVGLSLMSGVGSG